MVYVIRLAIDAEKSSVSGNGSTQKGNSNLK